MEFHKRGQGALFVLLIILIFLGLVGMIYHVDQLMQAAAPEKVAIEETPIVNAVTVCIGDLVAEGVSTLYRYGGFIDAPEKSVKLERQGSYRDIALYSDLTYYFVPTTTFMEDQLRAYLDGKIERCLNTFSSGEVEVTSTQAPETNVAITEDGVLVTVHWPMTLTKGRTTKTIESFSASVERNLLSLHGFAAAYLDAQKEKPFLRLQVLKDLLRQQDLSLTLWKAAPQDVVFALDDRSGDEFLFAVRYNWNLLDTSFTGLQMLNGAAINALGLPIQAVGEKFLFSDTEGLITVPVAVNHPPIFEPIGTQYVDIGKTLHYQLPVSDPDGDTLLFDFKPKLPGMEINRRGEFVWGPTNYQEVELMIKACDHESCVTQPFHIIVGRELPIPELPQYSDLPQKKYR